jgi:hypothetical protein
MDAVHVESEAAAPVRDTLPPGLQTLGEQRRVTLRRLEDALELRGLVAGALDGKRFDEEDLERVQKYVLRLRDDLVTVCEAFDRREQLYSGEYLELWHGLTERRRLIEDADRRTGVISSDNVLAAYFVRKQLLLEEMQDKLRTAIEAPFVFKQNAPVSVPPPPAAARGERPQPTSAQARGEYLGAPVDAPVAQHPATPQEACWS